MKTIVRIEEKSKRHEVEGSAGVAEGHPEMVEYDSRIAMIRALIPLGLEAVKDLLEQEVTRLAGERYERVGGLAGHARWGSQRGSVYLSDQKVAMRVPRVRDTVRGQEVPLSTYQSLREPRQAEEAALRKILKGLSCRDYEGCVEPVAETFGLKASSLSRRFKRASARKLMEGPHAWSRMLQGPMDHGASPVRRTIGESGAVT